jgi:predicted DNA repair protein MutK
MATSLLVLLDDIATILDDVAVMGKIAAKKTAGVLGDDLALNAQQVAGVSADRELPVVWAVAKGSALNKVILVPAALLISMFVPWLITPLLMLGGAYLCFEGFEKIAHKFLHSKEEDKLHHDERVTAHGDSKIDMVEFEKNKIKGAIRTDFILSAEIVVIALGTVAASSFGVQVAVVVGISILMTVGVYSIVAGIVKLDDAGFYLIKEQAKTLWGSAKRGLGQGLLWFAPRLMKGLSIVGTAAMFMVGGGILVHGIPHSHEVLHHITETVEKVSVIGSILVAVIPTLLNALAGVIAGGLVLLGVLLVKKFIPQQQA